MAKNLLLALAIVVGLAGLTSQDAAGASEFKVLYSLCAEPNCTDGVFLPGGLLRDPSGTLYGVAYTGGATPNGGTVFALTPDGGDWQLQVLYSFCTQANCADGKGPDGGLVEDTLGNLYGTTLTDSTGGGTVFKLARNAARTSWTHSVLYTFCQTAGCPDGQSPHAPLTYQGAVSGAPYDGTSPLYGITQTGGSTQGGVVYQLAPGAGGSWTETVIDDLCQGSGCKTGHTPGGGLLMDASGNLFLNTAKGGGADAGTIIELSEMQGSWTAKQIYSFCATTDCTEGKTPSGTLAIDPAGHLFGTAEAGGTHQGGVLFELSPAKRKWKEHVLYDFCKKSRCKDGTPPVGVTLDGSGGLIGAAAFGGDAREGAGTLYRFSSGAFHLLHTFCTERNCPDGILPSGAFAADGAGNYFGTTYEGGTGGVIFEITP